MYEVVVYERDVRIASKNFPYGEWKEIGFWLNDHELIDKLYRVEINFTR